MRLERVVDVYLRHVTVERGLSAHTTAAYRRDLRDYLAWLAGEGIDDIEAVTQAATNGYLAARAVDEPAPAASTLARVQSSIRGLHRFAVAEGLAQTDPSARLRPPKQAARLPKALTIAQIERLLEASSVLEEGVGDDAALAALRDRALLELLYATGARVSEVVQLDVDDLVGVAPGAGATAAGAGAGRGAGAGDDEPGTHARAVELVRLRGKGDKERIVPLGSFARTALDAYFVRARPILATRGRATPRAFLGLRGVPLSRQSAWLVIQKAAAAAKLDVAVSPHTFRHSFATHLLQGGADVRVVQELLGHSSVATTQIYTLVTVDSLRDVYATAHPRAR